MILRSAAGGQLVKVSTQTAQTPKIVYLRRVKGIQPKMRKIETQMNAAIKGNANWTKANTMVTTVNNVSHVFLHGNKIAEVGDDFVKVFDGGFQSVTTKSRLNALCNEFGVTGEGVFQKNFEWFIRLWNGTEFFTTEFRNGMRLA